MFSPHLDMGMKHNFQVIGALDGLLFMIQSSHGTHHLFLICNPFTMDHLHTTNHEIDINCKFVRSFFSIFFKIDVSGFRRCLSYISLLLCIIIGIVRCRFAWNKTAGGYVIIVLWKSAQNATTSYVSVFKTVNRTWSLSLHCPYDVDMLYNERVSLDDTIFWIGDAYKLKNMINFSNTCCVTTIIWMRFLHWNFHYKLIVNSGVCLFLMDVCVSWHSCHKENQLRSFRLGVKSKNKNSSHDWNHHLCIGPIHHQFKYLGFSNEHFVFEMRDCGTYIGYYALDDKYHVEKMNSLSSICWNLRKVFPYIAILYFINCSWRYIYFI